MAVEMLSASDATQNERDTSRRMISENIERADQMIQELLNESRIKSGEQVAEIALGDIANLLGSTVKELQSLYGSRIELAVASKDLGKCNVNHLRRIIENLVGNAVKYGDLEKSILISADVVPNGTQISVHNYGNPIAVKDLNNLFDLFARSESAMQGSEKGWGIGLAVVHTLVEEMNGAIEVKSSEGSGTTFTILLRSC